MPSIWRSIKQNTDRWLALFVGSVSFFLYWITLPPTVLFGDAGEFQFAAPLAGIAHPTGYPLYLLLGWLWTHLIPFWTPAYKMSLFSAVTAAVGVSFLYLAARRFLALADLDRHSGLAHGIALVAALFFAVSHTFWSEAIIAEVYALHVLLIAVCQYLLLRWLKGDKEWTSLIPFAILLGLALGHHRTSVLLAVGFVLALWIADRRGRVPRLKLGQLLILVGLTALPQLVYIYLPLRAPHTEYIIIPLHPGAPLVLFQNDLAGFLHHVLGRSFEGSITPALLGQERLGMAVALLQGQFGWLGIAIGLAGALWLVFRRHWILLATTLPGFLLLFLFNLIYDIGDIYVMFIPNYLIWGLWMALGLAWLCRQSRNLVVRLKGALSRNGSKSPLRRLSNQIQLMTSWSLVALFALLPLTTLVANYPSVSRSNDWQAWTMWQQILAQPLPEGAVLVSNDRDEIMPLWYFRLIDRRRPDLIGIYPGLIEGQRFADVGLTVDEALSSGRPVYLIKAMHGIGIKYDLAPAQAGMMEVLGLSSDSEPQRTVNYLLADKVRLIGYDHSPYSVAPGKELIVSLYWQAETRMSNNYITFVQLLDRGGNRVAGNDHLAGNVYYPTSLWKPGETLLDTHRFVVPSDTSLGAYRLFVGMYEYPSMARLGDVTLGHVGVKTAIETTARIPPHLLDAYFEDKFHLSGYEWRKEGQSILLTLQWQAISHMQKDYTTFVHLVDENGAIVSQADSQPLGGTYPTSIWDEGEVVIDAYRLPMEMDTPVGEYTMLIGLYLLDDMSRLQIFDAQQNHLGDYLVLQTVSWP